jgi:hypothetical protein
MGRIEYDLQCRHPGVWQYGRVIYASTELVDLLVRRPSQLVVLDLTFTEPFAGKSIS